MQRGLITAALLLSVAVCITVTVAEKAPFAVHDENSTESTSSSTSGSIPTAYLVYSERRNLHYPKGGIPIHAYVIEFDPNTPTSHAIAALQSMRNIPSASHSSITAEGGNYNAVTFSTDNSRLVGELFSYFVSYTSLVDSFDGSVTDLSYRYNRNFYLLSWTLEDLNPPNTHPGVVLGGSYTAFATTANFFDTTGEYVVSVGAVGDSMAIRTVDISATPPKITMLGSVPNVEWRFFDGTALSYSQGTRTLYMGYSDAYGHSTKVTVVDTVAQTVNTTKVTGLPSGRIAGLAYCDSTSTLYATVDTSGTISYNSYTLGTIDVEAGTYTSINETRWPRGHGSLSAFDVYDDNSEYLFVSHGWADVDIIRLSDMSTVFSDVGPFAQSNYAVSALLPSTVGSTLAARVGEDKWNVDGGVYDPYE